MTVIPNDTQGFTYSDVTEKTNATIDTVKSRLFGAGEKFKWVLGTGFANDYSKEVKTV
jgi:hypothetical protein